MQTKNLILIICSVLSFFTVFAVNAVMGGTVKNLTGWLYLYLKKSMLSLSNK